MVCCLVGAKTIIWTDAGILPIGPKGANLNEILIEIQKFGLKKIKKKKKLSSSSHYSDVIMDTRAPEITSRTIVYSKIYSGAD